jgi:oligoribonuclease (3'-5' exoribonuclease)
LSKLKNDVKRLTSALTKANERLVHEAKQSEQLKESMKKQTKELRAGKHKLNEFNKSWQNHKRYLTNNGIIRKNNRFLQKKYPFYNQYCL